MSLKQVLNGCYKLALEKAEQLAFESTGTTQAGSSLIREGVEGDLEKSGGDSLEHREALTDLIASSAIAMGLLNRVMGANSDSPISQTAQHALVDAWSELKSGQALIEKIGEGYLAKASKALISQQLAAGARCTLKGLELIQAAVVKFRLGNNWSEAAQGVQRFLMERPAIGELKVSIAAAVSDYSQA